ncbi:MAG: PH domain-containing protein [Cryomorphaceae bacterium]
METVWHNLEVPMDELPKVEEVHFQKHPLRYRNYRYLLAAFWLGIPLIGAAVLAVVVREPWTFAVAGGIVLVSAFVSVAVAKGFSRRAYALREKDLTYRKGWIFTSVTTVPFNRIQHTEVSQGPLERKFKLCKLNIYTAGGSTSDLSVPGLEANEAAQLRDYVAKKAARYA